MIQHLPHDKQTSEPIVLVCTGDLVLDVPEPEYWLEGIAPVLQAADITIGHLEVPHTTVSHELEGDVPAPGADPAHLAALVYAGFTGVTLAGNHIADCGTQGIDDTVAELDRLGIAHSGAGKDLASARAPMMLAAGNRRIAVFSYNCIGPANAWAGPDSAGCAYLPVATADGSAGVPASTYTAPLPEAAAILEEDIAKVRNEVDLVIVALHKGTVHTPAIVEDYEKALSRSAVTAGADIVIGHHAHIIRGIEYIQGKPVFHGLGNGCVVTRALSPDQDHAARAAWAEKRKVMFGFEPDPAYELAPFHPEAVNGFVARFACYPDGRLEAGLVPVFVDPPGRPRLASESEAEKISAYVQEITTRAGLGTLSLKQRQDMVVIE